jgi:hypothetical protein
VNRGVSQSLTSGVQTSFDFGNEVHAKVWPSFVPRALALEVVVPFFEGFKQLVRTF